MSASGSFQQINSKAEGLALCTSETSSTVNTLGWDQGPASRRGVARSSVHAWPLM